MKQKLDCTAVGKRGERAAARYLKKCGFRIVARNVHLAHNELDLVARNHQYIVFVEVKTRSFDSADAELSRPALAVGRGKQLRTAKAAHDYLRLHPTRLIPRLDVIEVYLDRSRGCKPFKVHHIPSAFSPDGTVR